MRRWARGWLLGAVAVLAACASPDRVPLGSSLDATRSQLGAPTAIHPLDGGGQRLQYSYQPAGPWVHNLDFDAAGRLQRHTQVMDPADFAQIVVGHWNRDDVRRRYGAPALVERVARFDGVVWTYRFLDNQRRRQLHVHLDPAGVVRQILTTDEPEPEPLDPLTD